MTTTSMPRESAAAPGPASPGPVITVDHLRKTYGAGVGVRDVSFRVERGEIFGIIGPNGAGKTTTVECICGLRVPDSGVIEVLGLDPQVHRATIRERVGVQLQESALPLFIKVGEAMELFASFYRQPADPAELLTALGLADKHNSRGFWELVKMEGRRAQRAPVGLLLGVLVPVILLIIFSAIPGLKQLAPGSTLTMFTQYVPVLIAMSVCLIGLVSLPLPVVSDRQAGVLRRFATTPAPPSWVLAAQVIVNLALALIAIVILVAGSVLFFGVHLPSQWGGFVLSALLCTAAMFGIGLLITALVPSPQVAGVVGTVLLYPLLFFAGMWTPRQNLSPAVQHSGNYTPLDAAAQAMDAAMQGHFPPARPLLVMAAYALVCGAVAIRLFRWE